MPFSIPADKVRNTTLYCRIIPQASLNRLAKCNGATRPHYKVALKAINQAFDYGMLSLLITLKALESKQFRSTALYSILLDCKIMLKIIPA